MSGEAAYSIADLARLTGVNVRTIRYYLAQGLLPASGESGPGAHYGDGHLNRLRLTKRLQEQHLPLAEIRRRLAELSDLEVATFVAAPPEPERTTAGSALDYVRTVLGGGHQPNQGASRPGPGRTPAPSEAHDAESTPSRSVLPAAAAPTRTTGSTGPSLLRRAFFAESDHVSEQAAMPRMRDTPAAAPAQATEPPEPLATERSQWERLSLGPNVEIHIRRPLSRIEQRRVERLITIARQVLKEDKP